MVFIYIYTQGGIQDFIPRARAHYHPGDRSIKSLPPLPTMRDYLGLLVVVIYITRRLIHARIQALCVSAIGIYI